VQVVKVQDEIAGNFAPSPREFDPVTGEFPRPSTNSRAFRSIRSGRDGFSGSIDLDHPNATAEVRNVERPSDYSRILLAEVAPIALEPEVRDWINAYVPGGKHETSSLPADAQDHVLWATT
jgi:hypothetical protein